MHARRALFMPERERCALGIKFVLVAVIPWFMHSCILTPCTLMLKKPLFARKHVYFSHCTAACRLNPAHFVCSHLVQVLHCTQLMPPLLQQ